MTMTITAKFASRCATCGETITPGTKIEWTKGAPVRHTACPTTGVATVISSTRVLVADMPRPRYSSQRDPDMYTDRRTGETLMRGCGQCRRLGRMCKSCAFDEYDN